MAHLVVEHYLGSYNGYDSILEFLIADENGERYFASVDANFYDRETVEKVNDSIVAFAISLGMPIIDRYIDDEDDGVIVDEA